VIKVIWHIVALLPHTCLCIVPILHSEQAHFSSKCSFPEEMWTPHLIHGLLGLDESALWMASWSIQPFLHSLPVCPRHKPCYVWLAGKICALVQTMQLSNNQIETVMIALCTCVKLCEKVTFNCSCVSGYVGRYCEHLLDLCNGSDCRHNATCIPLYDSLSYRCLCSPGQSHC